MLEIVSRINGKRSTGRLSAKGMRPLIDLLDSSVALFRHDMGRGRRGADLKFSAVQMMTILLFIEVKKLTLEGFRQITEGRGGQRVLANLGMPRGSDGRFIRPSDGWISDFRNHEYPLFRQELEAELRETVMARAGRGSVFTVDSTPLEASRYSGWGFNPHYRIRMAKAHIIMVDGVPLLSSFTDGDAGDNPELIGMLSGMGRADLPEGMFCADGGYDSWRSYLEVFVRTGMVMSGNTGSDGVVHKEATWENVLRRYNRLSRLRGFRPSGSVAPEFVLRFLASHGEGELVGWFLRNLDMARGAVLRREAALKRHVCETVHHAMKRWVDLTVRGLQRGYAERRTALRLAFCTMLALLFEPYTD